MNKKISFPIAIIIIVVCAVLVGIIAWQYRIIPGIGPSGPSPRPSAKEFTIGLDEEAKIIYETEITHEEFLISLKNIDILNKSVEVDLKREYEGFCNFPEAIRFGGRPSNMLIIGESAFCYTTEECGVEFKLIKLQDTKATFETSEGCAPPGPKGPFLPKEIIIKKIEKVSITTDKTEYEQGGEIKITVKNNLDKSIWYVKKMCPSSCCNLFKLEDSEWKNLGNSIPCMVMDQLPSGTPYYFKADELKPGESITKQWESRAKWGKYVFGSGKYRFSFFYGLSKDNYTEKTIYSNEFTIKEKELTKELIFVTILGGYYCGYDESRYGGKKNYVINNNEDWQSLWNKVYSIQKPTPPLPTVDFSKDIVIAVFQGVQGSGGYSIEIIKIVEAENSIKVFVRETSPGPSCTVTDALTQPYHIIKISKTDKEVIFKTEKKITVCEE